MFSTTIENKDEMINGMISKFKEDLKKSSMPENEKDLFLLAFVEALFNAGHHGNQSNPDLKIEIRYHLSENLNMVSITDQGNGFTPVIAASAIMDGTRGRGLAMIGNLCDLVFFNRKGNQINFLKGGKTGKKEFPHGKAGVYLPQNRIAIISEIQPGRDFSIDINHLIEEIIEDTPPDTAAFFWDLKNIETLPVPALGSISRLAKKEHIESVTLFNAETKIFQDIESNGLMKNGEAGFIINVFKDTTEIYDLLSEKSRDL